MMFKTYKLVRVGNYKLVLETRRLWFSKKAKFRLRLLDLRNRFSKSVY